MKFPTRGRWRLLPSGRALMMGCILFCLGASVCASPGKCWATEEQTATSTQPNRCTLRVRFVYDGQPPEPTKISESSWAALCGDSSLTDQLLIVNPINRGIKNIVVYVYEGSGGVPLPAMAKEPASASTLPEHPKAARTIKTPKTHTLANVDCNFEPRMLVMQAGDTLTLNNTDAVGYNAMFGFLKNPPRNISLPPKATCTLQVDASEPAPIPVDCTIYPWMKARVIVLNHRLAAVSDDNGLLTLSGLPVGCEATFRIYHESANFRGLKIGANQVDRRAVFRVKLTGAKVDLGTVSISPERFTLLDR